MAEKLGCPYRGFSETGDDRLSFQAQISGLSRLQADASIEELAANFKKIAELRSLLELVNHHRFVADLEYNDG